MHVQQIEALQAQVDASAVAPCSLPRVSAPLVIYDTYVAWELFGVSRRFLWDAAFEALSDEWKFSSGRDNSKVTWRLRAWKKARSSRVEVGVELMASNRHKTADARFHLFLQHVGPSLAVAHAGGPKGFDGETELCTFNLNLTIGDYVRMTEDRGIKPGLTLGAVQRAGCYNPQRDSIGIICRWF